MKSPWTKYFFGSPKRCKNTLVFICIIIALINPKLLEMAVQRLFITILPLLGSILPFVILFAAFRKILSPLLKIGKQK